MILQGTSIGHNCIIGENTFIGPGCNILGGVKIGKNCLIGAGTTIYPSITVGEKVHHRHKQHNFKRYQRL